MSDWEAMLCKPCAIKYWTVPDDLHPCPACTKALRQCWATPPDLWEWIAQEWKPTIDVCAIEANAKCRYFITPEMDGLASQWFDNHAVAFCNPPFGAMLPWLRKAYGQTCIHPGTTAVVLGPADHTTKWFAYAYHMAFKIILLTPHVKFIPPPGIKASSPAAGHALYIFDYQPWRWPAQIEVEQWKK